MTEGGHFEYGADARRDLDEDREAGAARARGSGKLPGVVQPEAPTRSEARRHHGWPDGETRSRVEQRSGTSLVCGARTRRREANRSATAGDEESRATEADGFPDPPARAIGGSEVPVAASAPAPPGPIPNPVVTRRSAGEYCGGDSTGGEAVAGASDPRVADAGIG